MSGKYALIIGNTEYADRGLAKLNAPGKDAGDFARVLRDPNICAFDKVFTFLNRDVHTVNQAIDDFFTRRKPDDLLLFYFSGHGVRDENGALYLAVKDTNRTRLLSTAIRSDFIRGAMDQSRSKRQVLILDCCNSGAFTRGEKSPSTGTMGAAIAFEGKGHVILTASDAIQFALDGDQVIGSGVSNSLFTHFLIKGLEGEADQDGDGKINIDDLYDYAYAQVITTTSKQTPGKWAYSQHGEIILRQSKDLPEPKPQPLPLELNNAIESPLPYVREGAVKQLEEILGGKNARLAQSAREALEKIAAGDDSTRVSTVAKQALQPASLPIQNVEKNRHPSKREIQKRQNRRAIWVAPAIIGAFILFLSLGIVTTRAFWLPFFQASIPSPSITRPGIPPVIQTEVLTPTTFASTPFSDPTSEPTQPTSAVGMSIIPTATEAAPLPTNTEQILLPNTAQRENPIDGATLIYIPPGKFTMGLTPEQARQLCPSESCDQVYAASQPDNPVTITQGYWIYQTEVSNAQYAQFAACVSSGNCDQLVEHPLGGRPEYYDNPTITDYPVVFVNWYDAGAYCKWSGGRLPTSAEWEYAARGNTRWLYPWGNEFLGPNQANVNNPQGDTQPVYSHLDSASPFGLLNMTGNVWEWVADWYSLTYYRENTDWTDPQGPSGGTLKVGRGGSWEHDYAIASVAIQDWYAPTDDGSGVGFRCVWVER